MAKMVKFKWDTSKVNIKGLIKDLGPEKVAQILYTSSEAVLVPAVRALIKKNESVDTGNLFRNIRSKATVSRGDGAVLVGSIGVDYGLNVELGSKPHTPDFGRLLDWVRRKIKPSVNPVVVTINISRAIQKRGVAPRPYIIPAFVQTQNRMVNDFVVRMKIHLRTR